MSTRVKVRVVLHYDPQLVDWFELRQCFLFSSWSMYHHVRMNGRQPDLVAAIGHVPARELAAYHALPRERLGKLPFWVGDVNGCPFPENTGAVCEDAAFVVDERTTTAFERPSTWSGATHVVVDDAALEYARASVSDVGHENDGDAAAANKCTKHNNNNTFRAAPTVVKCRTGGHVVCKLLHIRDAFGWPIVDLENATDTPPEPLPDLRVPIARHAHFLLGSAYRDAHDSARRRSLQFMWQRLIPQHHQIVFIVESTSEESHRLHVHVPNASFISGDWEPDLDGYRHGEPNVIAAARREVHEETGILIDGCDAWMFDWAGVRTTVESGGAFTRLQEVLFVVNLNNLAARQRTTPLHMLHPRVTPRVFNELAPMVPQWHMCACKERAFLDMCYQSGGLPFDTHTTASPLRLCVYVYAHDQQKDVCVHRDAVPLRHFDILFSTLDARKRILSTMEHDQSLFVFAWHT